MLHFERWKIIAVVLVCLAGVLFTLPNFFSKQTVDSWPGWLPHRQLPLGLDLQGGAHLLLASAYAQMPTVRRDDLGLEGRFSGHFPGNIGDHSL